MLLYFLKKWPWTTSSQPWIVLSKWNSPGIQIPKSSHFSKLAVRSIFLSQDRFHHAIKSHISSLLTNQNTFLNSQHITHNSLWDDSSKDTETLLYLPWWQGHTYSRILSKKCKHTSIHFLGKNSLFPLVKKYTIRWKGYDSNLGE